MEFLKSSQQAEYRFSGAELIDPEQKLVMNRYFAIVENGQLVACGQDWGPRDTVWEVGDVMPGQARNTGGEAVIDQILPGEMAKRHIAFLLRTKSISGVN